MSCRGGAWAMSRPSKRIAPPVGVYSRVISRPVVDLPQPDSPTSPREPPSGTWNETPSTACTWPTVRRMTPDDFTGKYILRLSTSRTGLAEGEDSGTRVSSAGSARISSDDWVWSIRSP